MREISRLAKYCLVGASGTIIDVALIYIFVEYIGLGIILSAIFSFAVAATSNFILNKIWTFDDGGSRYGHQYIRFFLVSVIGMALTASLMYLFTFIFGIWYVGSKLLTSAIVLIWNYLGNRNWTFKKNILHEQESKVNRYDISIVIPAYNEDCRIVNTLKKVSAYIRSSSLKIQIVVVNDGSKDNTLKVCTDFSIGNEKMKVINLIKNQGKGNAVKVGVENSESNYVLFYDADGSTPIEELTKVYDYIQTNDVVIGSRKIDRNTTKKKQSIFRRFISELGSFVNGLLVRGIKDTQCGFKLVRKSVADRVLSKQIIKRFGYDLEFLAICQKYGYSIREVPIEWADSGFSNFRPFKDTFITMWDFVRIQINFLNNKY